MPQYEGPYMDIEEARSLGVIQEINRLVLHPRGLALAVVPPPPDAESGEAFVCMIWDQRDDPEGLRYEDVELAERAALFEELLKKVGPTRVARLGYVIQPVDDRPHEGGMPVEAPERVSRPVKTGPPPGVARPGTVKSAEEADALQTGVPDEFYIEDHGDLTDE